MKDNIKKITGRVQINRYDEDLKLIESQEFDNLVVTTGLNWVAGRMGPSPAAVMNYIALGNSGTAPALGDTTLVSETFRSAVTVNGGAVSANSVVYSLSMAAGVGTGSYQEAGLFNANSGGTMLSRVVFPVVNKGASDTVTITWTISVG